MRIKKACMICVLFATCIRNELSAMEKSEASASVGGTSVSEFEDASRNFDEKRTQVNQLLSEFRAGGAFEQELALRFDELKEQYQVGLQICSGQSGLTSNTSSTISEGKKVLWLINGKALHREAAGQAWASSSAGVEIFRLPEKIDLASLEKVLAEHQAEQTREKKRQSKVALIAMSRIEKDGSYVAAVVGSDQRMVYVNLGLREGTGLTGPDQIDVLVDEFGKSVHRWATGGGFSALRGDTLRNTVIPRPRQKDDPADFHVRLTSLRAATIDRIAEKFPIWEYETWILAPSAQLWLVPFQGMVKPIESNQAKADNDVNRMPEDLVVTYVLDEHRVFYAFSGRDPILWDKAKLEIRKPNDESGLRSLLVCGTKSLEEESSRPGRVGRQDSLAEDEIAVAALDRIPMHPVTDRMGIPIFSDRPQKRSNTPETTKVADRKRLNRKGDHRFYQSDLPCFRHNEVFCGPDQVIHLKLKPVRGCQCDQDGVPDDQLQKGVMDCVDRDQRISIPSVEGNEIGQMADRLALVFEDIGRKPDTSKAIGLITDTELTTELGYLRSSNGGEPYDVVAFVMHGCYRNAEKNPSTPEEKLPKDWSGLQYSLLFLGGGDEGSVSIADALSFNTDHDKNGHGVLNGVEAVKNLDLRGTRLTMLVGCETGKGDINGDNVAAMRQAFTIAMRDGGSVIATSWTVDATAAEVWLDEFSEQYFNKKQDLPDAIRAAALKVKKEMPHPLFWAPFVVTGNPVGLSGGR